MLVDGSHRRRLLWPRDRTCRESGPYRYQPLRPGLAGSHGLGLGIGDHTVIWMYQQDAQAIRLIDYYAAAGYGFDHYAEVLQSKRYRWGQHYLPHDVTVKELGTGKSRIESLSALGISATVVRKLSVEDGINAVRRILPRCWFDRDTCAEGIKALRQYRREWDDQRKVFYERPYHDWASHPADAFRYLAIGLDEPSQRMAVENMPETGHVMGGIGGTMVEMDEKTALIADLELALAQANGRLIELTEELGPWKARALRAEKLIEGGLSSGGH